MKVRNASSYSSIQDETVSLVSPEEILAGCNYGEDVSNMIVLPGKKKKKGGSKYSEKSKKKEAPILSKKKQRKLKQLEEEKRKKLLQAKSIQILEKHKIWDGAYPILHSSGTIGQAETFKTKRFRAVQLSKAGLEVPEDILTFKGKGNDNVADSDEVPLKLDSETSLSKNVGGDNVIPLKRKENDDDTHNQFITTKTISKCQKVVDGGIGMSLPYQEAKEMIGYQKLSSYDSASFNRGHDSELNDKVLGSSYEKDHYMKAISNATVQDHVSSATVVHVSRPDEVEEKRQNLPIIMMEQEIMEAINENLIVILCGETGCGKTTQVPQFLYEAGFGSSDCSDRKGIIGVTQPRRIAVLATAKRVSYELGLCLGNEVGFQVRHDKLIGKNCSIKFMTDGILLREVQSDFLLKRYSIIILDEAHERSLNTDILIGMLSRIIKLRQKLYMEQQEKLNSGATISPENLITPLRLVLMSATLRVEDFTENQKLFNQSPPVLEVSVSSFPVTIHFSKSTHRDYLGQTYKKVMAIHKRLPPGGILVFVTGQREVEFLCKKLHSASQQLMKKSSEKQVDNNLTSSSDVDMKEVNEAFEIGNDSPFQQTERSSSYEDDGDNYGSNYSDSTDSDTESDFEFLSEGEDSNKSEVLRKSGLVIDFLRDFDKLSSLKASFDALAGNSANPSDNGEESLSNAPSLEKDAGPGPLSASPLHVLPLYAMLPAAAQLRVFEEVPEGERLVVVATNVAETSLTIPGIKYVVDTGKEKIKSYNHTNGMATYEVSWISKASAAQRAGRAGRMGPGHCYRLYSAAAFSKDDIFPKFSSPEISKIPVDGVVLLMKSMGIDKVVNFPFPSPPNSEALLEAEHCLKSLEAIDSQGRLTSIGRAMAQYPISPRHSRMLLTIIKIMRNQKGCSRANLILGYAIASAAALCFPNPFLMQFGENHWTDNDMGQEEKVVTERIKDQHEKQRQKKLKAIAKEARARFCNPTSDALTIAYALQLFELAADKVKFCSDNLIHLKTMEEMSKLRKQLLQLIFHQSKFCNEFAWNHGTAEDVEFSWSIHCDKQPLRMNEEELIGQSICAGWSDRVAKRVHKIKDSSENDTKVRAVRYQSCALQDAVYLHRQSSVSQSAPELLVYNELLQTNRAYMLGVTCVKSDWLVRHASALCTFSAPLTDPKPYYEPLSDQILCWVSPTFGRHNWQQPLHTLPVKDDIIRRCVFAAALLEGHVLPCLRSVQKYLAAPPSSMLRPEALGQRRVGDLINRLKIGFKTIDSRAMLREKWNEDPRFLQQEIQNWFQDGFYNHFVEIWGRMHIEVHLEGHELFSKRAKKERKKTEI